MESNIPSVGEVSAWKQAILDRRAARKAATVERNRQKRIAAGLPPDPLSHAERAARKAAYIPPRECNRLEKQFAASIGITWCGTCKEWKNSGEFYKGERRCKKHSRKTGMSKEEYAAYIKAKFTDPRQEAARKKAEEREDRRQLALLKKHWWSVVKPLFWKLTKDQYREQAAERHQQSKRQKIAEKAGFPTWEAYQAWKVSRPHPKAKSPEHHKERRRIRDQWRMYRRRVKKGQSANGGRIPAGWMVKQREAQGGQCALCWKPLPEVFEIDHIIPVSWGGPNVAENLQLVCPTCNYKKNDNPAANFA